MKKLDHLLTNKILVLSIYFLLGAATFFGRINLMQPVTEGSYQKNFYHPYIQALIIFTEQTFCLPAYSYLKRKQIKQPHLLEQHPIPPMKKYSLLIFTVGSLLQNIRFVVVYISASILPISTVPMIGSSTIIFTMLFEKIINKTVFERRHFLSCVLAVTGVAIVGASVLAENSNSSPISVKIQLIGVGLCITDTLCTGLQFTYEEYLFTKYQQIHPLQMAGWQGLFGIFISATIVAILTVIQCPFVYYLCSIDQNNNFYMESPSLFLKELAASPVLISIHTFQLIFVPILIFFNIVIIKKFQAFGRALFSSAKTGFVWAIGLVVTLIGRGSHGTKFQSTNGWVNFIKLIGFIFLIFAISIYSKIIPVGPNAQNPLETLYSNNQTHTQSEFPQVSKLDCKD